MTDARNGHTTWRSVAIAVLIPVVLGVFAVVTMRADLRNLQGQVDTKANQETVVIMNQNILRELQAINRRLDRIAP